MEVTLDIEGHVHDLVLAKDGQRWTLDVDGQSLAAHLERNGSGILARIGDRSLHVELIAPGEARIDGHRITYRIQSVRGTTTAAGAQAAHTVHVRPPMNGKLERILVAAGQDVQKGDVLFVLEAMKMHNEVKAPQAGRVAAIHVQAGATVEPRQIILDLDSGAKAPSGSPRPGPA